MYNEAASKTNSMAKPGVGARDFESFSSCFLGSGGDFAAADRVEMAIPGNGIQTDDDDDDLAPIKLSS